MADDGHDVALVRCGEGGGGGVGGHEGVEGGNGVFAVGADEEGDGDEEAEGVVGELFLDEAEVRGGEGWEGDAGICSGGWALGARFLFAVGAGRSFLGCVGW